MVASATGGDEGCLGQRIHVRPQVYPHFLSAWPRVRQQFEQGHLPSNTRLLANLHRSFVRNVRR
jgi:hypothetical protein